MASAEDAPHPSLAAEVMHGSAWGLTEVLRCHSTRAGIAYRRIRHSSHFTTQSPAAASADDRKGNLHDDRTHVGDSKDSKYCAKVTIAKGIVGHLVVGTPWALTATNSIRDAPLFRSQTISRIYRAGFSLQSVQYPLCAHIASGHSVSLRSYKGPSLSTMLRSGLY